jgi:glycosyltransferase involved in cell wall biosynthesis
MTRFADRGHRVDVLSSDQRLPGVADPANEHESHVHRDLKLYFRGGDLWAPSVPARWKMERANQRALRRTLDRVRPEVVSVWHMGALSLGLLTAVIEREIPIVYVISDDWLSYGPKLDAWARLWVGPRRSVVGRLLRPLVRVPTVLPDLGSSGVFCFVSDVTRRRAEEYSAWTFPISTLVPLGIEREVFNHLDRVEDRPWRWRILYTGRFDARKGVETLLRALPLLPPEATLGLYGRGGEDERARLTQLAVDLGVAGRVTFGQLDRDELAATYAGADVLVFPSEWEEPFGLVPIEAMACGTPVVATGTGGSGEFLVDGVNCLRFTAGQSSELAAAVQCLHDDPTLRRRLVAGGLATAEEFTSERMTEDYEAWHVAAARAFIDGMPPMRTALGVSGTSED